MFGGGFEELDPPPAEPIIIPLVIGFVVVVVVEFDIVDTLEKEVGS